MMKILGFDFVTKEKLKILRNKDFIVDDIAVVRRNRNNSSSSTNSAAWDTISINSEPAVDLDSNSASSSPSAITGNVKRFFGSWSRKPRPPFAIRRSSVPAGMNVGVNQMVQRCVIITRDENGYGLTVSGDNPVFVQSVKEDGAAARAGVRQGDRIIKVNGTLVTGANHMDVVKMISSGTYVALTLLGRPPSSSSVGGSNSNISSAPGQMTTVINDSSTPTIRHSMLHQQSADFAPSLSSSTTPTSGESPSTSTVVRRSITSVGEGKSKDFITGPQPVNEEKQAEWRRKRIHIICQMLEEEKKHVEELLAELKRNASDKTQQLLDQAQKRIKNLESQLSDFKNSQGGDQQPHSTSQNPPSSLVKHNAKHASTTAGDKTDGYPDVSSATVACKSKHQSTSEYASNNLPSGLHYVAPAQVDVVPMEESDSDTEAVVPLETEGPFINFAELKNRPAHLAVFLHYLISNCDPASLLFYLITDLYCYGSSKEMRRWAYEIHSTFLVPAAPLRVSAIDMSIVHEIDSVLYSLNDNDQDEAAKKIFVRARQKALDEISELLADFRNKRTLGLGNVFGESLLQNLQPGDVNRERKIVDSLLMQHFESFFTGTSDFDQLHDRQQAIAIALATILRHMNVKPSNSYHEKLLDKCPLFVTKEKKGFTLLAKPSKKAVQIKGHHFVMVPVFVSTFCYQCQEMIWGVNPQGYACSSCEVFLHKICAGSLEDSCYGRKRSIGKPPPPKILRPVYRDDSSDSLGAPLQAPPPLQQLPPPPTQPLIVPGATIITEEPEERTGVEEAEEMDKTTELPNSPMGGKENWATQSTSADSGYGGDVEKTLINVGRSQSMKSREEQHRLSKRNGDNGRRTKSDVDTDDKSIALAIGQESHTPQDMSVSSSSSSMSRTSLPESPTAYADILLRTSAESSSTSTTVTQQLIDINLSQSDSDLEADNEIPRLEDVLDWETVRHLKPKEKKRQEVIMELFHTERTHVRNLKVLRKVFYEPLLAAGILQPDLVKLLFANIEEILELHMKLNCSMKAIMKQNKLIGDIGDLMLPFLDGTSGDQFRRAVATFCQHQQHALEALKLRQKKDQKFAQFLQEAECSTVCRKLQLKDMIPMEMQRLTKYPLLLETVAKYTHEPSEELDKLKTCIDCAKGILEAVNTAKRNSENLRRLDELQRRLDTKEFDRVSHAMTKLYKNLDLRQHTLIHDGLLTWRMGKSKAVDLHVVLLEDLLVLLTRTSDGQRLSLKFHNTNFATKEEVKFTHCPLLKLTSLIAKNVATDKKGIFIVSTSSHGPQIYELVAQSTSEKKTWFKFITDQIDVCKQRDVPLHNNASTSGMATLSVNTTVKMDDGNNLASVSSSVDLSSQDIKLNDSCASSSDVNHVEEDVVPLERIQVISQPRLINPCEVQVCQPTILEHAEPVLTPLERLKRKDELILRSLGEKQKILGQILNLPQEDVANISETVMANKGNKDAGELALAAIVQTNRILEAINESMKLKREEEMEKNSNADGGESGVKLQLVSVDQPSVSCNTLTRIAAPLMKHLTGLLHCIQVMEEDLKRVRAELHHYKSLSTSTGNISREEATSAAAANSSCRSTSSDPIPNVSNVDDFLRVPKMSVSYASSDETITESKVHTPTAKSPSSPKSGSSNLAAESSAPSTAPRSPSPSTTNEDCDVNGRNEPTSFDQPLAESQSSDCLKSPESGDDEKKREKRKQRRQRHTALSGLEDPRKTSATDDGNVAAIRKGLVGSSPSPFRPEK